MSKLIVRLVIVAVLSATALTALAPAAYAGEGSRGGVRIGFGGHFGG